MKKRHFYLFTFKATMPNGEQLDFNKRISLKRKIKKYEELEFIIDEIKKEYKGVSNVVITFIHYLGR